MTSFYDLFLFPLQNTEFVVSNVPSVFLLKVLKWLLKWGNCVRYPKCPLFSGFTAFSFRRSFCKIQCICQVRNTQRNSFLPSGLNIEKYLFLLDILYYLPLYFNRTLLPNDIIINLLILESLIPQTAFNLSSSFI